jgi:hypothetical protein
MISCAVRSKGGWKAEADPPRRTAMLRRPVRLKADNGEPSMITIEHNDNLVNVAVLGEFTLADYKEFEQNALYKIGFGGKVNLLLDLRDMISYTVDVAWEEIKFSRAHGRDFGRIALVTDNQWLTWSAWVQRLFTNADIEVFDDYDAARAWAAGESGA